MMKRRGTWLLAALAWILTMTILLEVFQPSAPGYKVELHGHRGARGLAPENTLIGFGTALDLGVDTLEMDVGLTQDGVVVVSHDETLNPDITRDDAGHWITGPRRAIRELPLLHLQQFDVGRIRPGTDYANRFPGQEARDGQRIPELVEVLRMAERRGPVHYNIELKSSPGSKYTAPPETMLAAVLKVIRSVGVGARTTLQSFHWECLKGLKEVAPDIQTACLTSDETVATNSGPSPWTGLDLRAFGGSVPSMVHHAACDIWSPDFRSLTTQALEQAHELGLKVVVWTPDAPEDIRRLLLWKVDGIITDYPDRARSVMGELGLPLPAPLRG